MSVRAALNGDPLLIVTETPVLKRLRELPPGYRVRGVDTWGELAAAMENAPPSATVLADPFLGRRAADGPSPELKRVMLRRPMIPVVAVMPLRGELMAHADLLVKWGVSEVLNLNLQHPADAIRDVLRGVRARPLKREAERLMGTFGSENARRLVRASCEVAVAGGGAPEMAAIFGVDPRTVTTWCRREGVPPPRRLLAWARVLLASLLLREHGRSIVNVARGAGYANDHAVRRALRELAGCDPGGVERDKVFNHAAARFRDDLRKVRDRVRERRRDTDTGRTHTPDG
ncbi:MAG TPA: helix-turn-helix domain-containing protein [Longimicrobium sp.]|nr:helix-turn-helix domain-containing protein [Longimicrobium sp.]